MSRALNYPLLVLGVALLLYCIVGVFVDPRGNLGGAVLGTIGFCMALGAIANLARGEGFGKNAAESRWPQLCWHGAGFWVLV
jgi:hypothetical protein